MDLDQNSKIQTSGFLSILERKVYILGSLNDDLVCVDENMGSIFQFKPIYRLYGWKLVRLESLVVKLATKIAK